MAKKERILVMAVAAFFFVDHSLENIPEYVCTTVVGRSFRCNQ